MRKIRLVKNTFSSLLYQFTAIVCGFIVPRLILWKFGTNTNGLVNSIAQFLSVISFMELGMGAVVQSALYEPLAKKDYSEISRILVSAKRFFRNVGMLMLIYMSILMVVYPWIIDNRHDYWGTAILILAVGLSYFMQHYFGIVNSLLLYADQKGYIVYTVQTLIMIINTICCIKIMPLNVNIQVVKITTAAIYLLRPMILQIYVNRHYSINKKIEFSEEPIKQKWNGTAQHIAAVILDSTDAVILTVLSTLANVSIYTVYQFVVYGVKQIFMSMTNGLQSLLGDMWAKQEYDNLEKVFSWIEWALHTGTIFVFGCTGMLIVPFVKVYTNGVTDANYIQPLFAVLMTIAHAGHCLRLPYHLMIKATGHYKETQSNYIWATIMNVIVSIFLVKVWGLIGVAIGTLIAMGYQTIWMALYNSKYLIKWSFVNVIKQLLIDILCVLIGIMSTRCFELKAVNYYAWFCLAMKTSSVWILCILLVNIAFCRNRMLKIWGKIKKLK